MKIGLPSLPGFWRWSTRRIQIAGFSTMATSYADAAQSALAQQVIILFLAIGILDGGDILNICLIAFVAFWVGAGLIWRRRPKTPTKLDLMVIQAGYLPLCILSFLLVLWSWKLRGISAVF